jgi:hypothetical protein
MQARHLEVPYATWKSIAQNNSFDVYEQTMGTSVSNAWCGNREHVYFTEVGPDDFTDFTTTFATRTAVVSQDEAEAQIVGLANIKSQPRAQDGALYVVPEPFEGTAFSIITSNFCDKATWYPESTQVTGEVLTDSGDQLTYNPVTSRYWVDVKNGRITHEDNLLATYGVTIYVNDVEKTEHTPDTTDADYGVNYATGAVTFKTALAGGDVVKADYSYVNGSKYTITPNAGEVLRITETEVQFSEDVDLTDTVQFQVFMDIPGVGNIPVMTRKYKTMQDYINESNKSYPQIPALGGTGWRGMGEPIRIFRWDYKATIDLNSAANMRMEIGLVNNTNYGGTSAFATLYGTVLK